MIQTRIADGRGGYRELTVHDPEYWNGPYVYEPYPKALYRQTQPGEACETRVVANDSERDRLGSNWYESPADAKDAFERLEAAIAKAAAERAAADQKMSTLALAEAIRADRSTDQMLGEIPEQPKKRGRKPKVQTPIEQ